MLARMLRKADRPIRYAALDPAHAAAIRAYLRLAPRSYDLPHLIDQANASGGLRRGFGQHYGAGLAALRSLFDPQYRAAMLSEQDEPPHPHDDLAHVMGALDMYQDAGGRTRGDDDSGDHTGYAMGLLSDLLDGVHHGMYGHPVTHWYHPDRTTHPLVNQSAAHGTNNLTSTTLPERLLHLAGALRRVHGSQQAGYPAEAAADRLQADPNMSHLADAYDLAHQAGRGSGGDRVRGVAGDVRNHASGALSRALGTMMMLPLPPR
jgi:hypothetical protein